MPVLIAIAASCAYFVPQLEFNFTPQQFFRTDSDLGEYREEFSRTFGREDNLLVIAVQGENVFEPDLLGAVRNVTLEIRDLPTVKRAESIATFDIPRAGESPGSMTSDPILPQEIGRTSTGEAAPVDAELADRLETVAMEEPLVRSRLVSKDKQATVILTWLGNDVQAVSKLEATYEKIRAKLQDNPLPAGYRYRTGGVPKLRVEIAGSLQSEQLFFLPITGLIFLVVLAFLFRRPSGILLPVAVVLMAVAATIAFMVQTGASINIVNNVLPTVIFIIGIADSIHLLTRDAEEFEKGSDRLESVRKMIEHTGFACLMTSTTTAVGFISLVNADTAILKNFGWQAALGVMLAYFFSLLFLPPALAAMKPVERKFTRGGDEREELPMLEGYLMDFARGVLDHPWKVVSGSLVVFGIFGWFATWVVIDTTLLEVFHRDHPSYKTTEFIEQNFGGFLPVEVSLEADEEGRFKDPEVYARLDAFQREAASEEPVLSTQSLVDFHQSARVALLGDPDERDEMPESRAQIEQLHLLIAGSPDAENGPNQFITRNFDHARVLLRVADVGARAQIKLAKRLREKLDKHFGQFEGIDYQITGDAYVASVALDSFIRDLFYSLLLAGAVIFVLMALIFRSIKIGLISMIPNATPLLVTFGYMGLNGINLNSTTIIIFAIGLGLAVDDTIHVLARFREELDSAPTTRQAIMNTYFGAGRAIILTSILLLIGLSVLLFSDFIPTRQFGTLTSTTIVAAILGDLILLPPLLYLLYGEEETGV